MNTGEKHYYQGGYDYDLVEELPAEFECPICLLCQRDPQQTSCGHRFCSSCLVTWLSEGKTCPHDNTAISLADIFPDTIANREIQQLLVRCPDCQLVCCLAEYERHQCGQRSDLALQEASGVSESSSCPQCGDLLQEVSASAAHRDLICPNQLVACSFTAIGCTHRLYRRDVQVTATTGLTVSQSHLSLPSDSHGEEHRPPPPAGV